MAKKPTHSFLGLLLKAVHHAGECGMHALVLRLGDAHPLLHLLCRIAVLAFDLIHLSTYLLLLPTSCPTLLFHFLCMSTCTFCYLPLYSFLPAYIQPRT